MHFAVKKNDEKEYKVIKTKPKTTATKLQINMDGFTWYVMTNFPRSKTFCKKCRPVDLSTKLIEAVLLLKKSPQKQFNST